MNTEIRVSMSEDVHKAICAEAKKKWLTPSAYCRLLLNDCINKQIKIVNKGE